jgi:hypothetical protein
MKVSELIKELQKFDGNLDVLCSTEDESLISKNHVFRLLEITDISEIEAEKTRSEDGVASLKLEKTSYSQKHVIIDVTSDF